jgi:hypothetical protein
MPIIVSPQPGQPFGIGMTGTVDAQAFELVPDTWKIDFTILDVPETGRVLGYSSAQGLHHPVFDLTIGKTTAVGFPPTVLLPYPQWPASPHGSTVYLTSTVVGDVSGLVQTETIAITYDLLSGLQTVIPAASTASGSFTAADRAQLQATNNAVISTLPLNVSGNPLVDLGVDALQSGPPIELLGVSNDFIISGRGSIDRPSGSTGIYAYGCRWTLETAPLGLGKIEGVVNEYEQRIVQFALIKGSAGGFEYIDQLVNDHMGGGQMNWGIPFPKRLEYAILPFCTLRFRWLLFLQAP